MTCAWHTSSLPWAVQQNGLITANKNNVILLNASIQGWTGSMRYHSHPWWQLLSTNQNSSENVCCVWKRMCCEDNGDWMASEVPFRVAGNNEAQPCLNTQECCKSGGSYSYLQPLKCSCTSSTIPYQHWYCAHNYVTPGVSHGVHPMDPMNAQRWS